MLPSTVGDFSRFVLFPIRYPKIWDAYKTAQRSAWTAEEIALSVDRLHWNAVLTDSERDFLSMILGFFAASDGIVVENLAQRFCAEVDIPEARCFYGMQMMIENVHAETYSRFIQELVPTDLEQKRLFSAVNNIPAVKAKAAWCVRWIESKEHDFSTRLIAFAIVEGIFFSSSFAAIFWIRHRGLMPGLGQANQMISRDEGMHMRFACLLYKEIGSPVPEGVVHSMVLEAVEFEHAFFAAALPRDLAGMNVQLMRDYVEYVGDYLLSILGYSPLFYSKNPFPYMETTAVGARTNFFERPAGDYIGSMSATSSVAV
ncbi:putative ribonucleoside-diphosphate reductase small chain B [Earliella scabrosa]|nr:putative ribonucleoside-diphosphate reductase small chain B [Earliella scabrosa]KAI0713926.1 putative ribonucleoside-diphosphate reductase small chain B [Earliella scabrosa]